MIRFAEDRSKPAHRERARDDHCRRGPHREIAYTLSGVASPQVGATATLTGAGVSGKAAGLKLKAG